MGRWGDGEMGRWGDAGTWRCGDAGTRGHFQSPNNQQQTTNNKQQFSMNKVRKPGRAVFFQSQEVEQQQPETKVAATKSASPKNNPAEADSETVDNQSLQQLFNALVAVRDGEFSVRLPEDDGLGEIATVFNEMVSVNQNFANEMNRISQIVGEEGRLSERATLEAVEGSWLDSIDSVNGLINNLAKPTTEVSRVLTAVASGDLSQKIALQVEGKALKGEFLSIGTIVNTMVDQLNGFAGEVTRVAPEVGTEGKLGGSSAS